MFKYLFFLLISLSIIVHAADPAYEVTYESSSNGKISPRKSQITYYKGIVYYNENEKNTSTFTDYNKGENIAILEVPGEEPIKLLTPFSELPQASFDSKPETILGYTCKYARFSYFSNTIEVWYTEEAELKGTPMSTFLPTNKALVLKLIYNGNRETRAVGIEKVANPVSIDSLLQKAKVVTSPVFEEAKINGRFTKLQIFKEDTLNWDPSLPKPSINNLQDNITYRLNDGVVLMKRVTLDSSLLRGNAIFVKLKLTSNDDAYDRTGTVFLIPNLPEKNASMLDRFLANEVKFPGITDSNGKVYEGITNGANYALPIELMRFITSFGAGFFNDKRVINNYDWATDITYKQEITELIPNNTQSFWIGVHIGTYSKGGHKVDVELDFYPNSDEGKTSTEHFVKPLFNTLNFVNKQNFESFFRENALTTTFEIPEKADHLFLHYTPTGHGGWGKGDEFVPRENRIFIDGKMFFKVSPWRTDCATYRLSNPASGNFRNGLSSSDLSRSNWCPAMPTSPYLISLKDLEPGKHTIKIEIDQGPDEGSSTNSWHVTGAISGDTK